MAAVQASWLDGWAPSVAPLNHLALMAGLQCEGLQPESKVYSAGEELGSAEAVAAAFQKVVVDVSARGQALGEATDTAEEDDISNNASSILMIAFCSCQLDYECSTGDSQARCPEETGGALG
mmetsp:Transcript_6286/g.10615  ORF Transcript_6286/g.10615 Transcript_6286/m.10615 type:complete len:122 (-) Transcript_6286:247-612(-)